MANVTTDQNNVLSAGESFFRDRLALLVVKCVTGITVVLSTVAVMAVYYKSESFGSIKELLNILLPVLATWMGVVLTFYFAKENYESAARIAQQLTSEAKLKSIKIKDVMIKIGEAVKLELNKPVANINLKSEIIDAILEKNNKERLPILDDQGRIKYMAHRSLFDKFIVQEVAKPNGTAVLTLDDMLKDPKYKDILEGSFRTLDGTSNLADAKALMDNIKICNDVFVTEDGTKETKVLGWVTNIIVEEHSEV